MRELTINQSDEIGNEREKQTNKDNWKRERKKRRERIKQRKWKIKEQREFVQKKKIKDVIKESKLSKTSCKNDQHHWLLRDIIHRLTRPRARRRQKEQRQTLDRKSCKQKFTSTWFEFRKWITKICCFFFLGARLLCLLSCFYLKFKQ